MRTLATRNPGRTEADLQARVRDVLVYGGFDLGIEAVHLEQPAEHRRRLDVAVGALLIECKRDLRPSTVRTEAERQIGEYLAAKAGAGSRYLGILTDGVSWLLYRWRATGLEMLSTFVIEPAHVDDRRFRWWLGSILATEVALEPTAELIAARLGATSPSFALTRSMLQHVLAAARHSPGVAVKRQLWAKLLRSALGTQFEDTDALFVDHTYLVILATLIGHAVMGFDLTHGGYLPSILLSGQLFERAGIVGVGDAGFFDWVLDQPEGVDIVLDLVRRVRVFRWAGVQHDILKVLYQSVIAPVVRKRLGEYYTPDWLAAAMVDRVVTDPLHQRVVDPACGSGTFVFHAVRRYLDAADRAGIPPTEALARVVETVFGIDLHPVAVTLAQTTYLLAIGPDRLRRRPPRLAIPVYLGDSMRWELAADEGTFTSTGDIVLTTDDGRGGLFDTELRFPASVVRDVARFDTLVRELVDRATNRAPGAAAPAVEGLLQARAVPDVDRPMVRATYALLCQLHDEGRNHIWGFYIRNQARPAWLSQPGNQVDVLLGNPPWLAYRYMPPSQQQVFAKRVRERGLWEQGRLTTGQDLAAFFVIRAIELYLRTGGTFAFVMPRAVLSRQTYAAFRAGRYRGTPQFAVAFDTPWDLGAVDPAPFPVPACVVRGHLTENARALPTTVELWQGRPPSGVEAGTLQVLPGTVSSVDADASAGSPYRRAFRQGATLVPRTLVTVVAAPPTPLGTPEGLRAVRSRQTRLDKPPWNDLPAHVGTVESIFVRPAYLGESVAPFRLLAPVDAVIPYDGTRLLSGDDERIDRYPGLAAWWRWAEGTWATHRASERLSLLERLDYVHGLGSQFPIAPWRVVYTASGNTLAAAVVQDPWGVVEHKLYWAAVTSQDEGRYLTAVLNAPVISEMVKPYQSTGAFGPRDFDKYVWRLPIPVFDATNPIHRELVCLAQQAEALAASVAVPASANFQRVRRATRTALRDAALETQLNDAARELLIGTHSR